MAIKTPTITKEQAKEELLRIYHLLNRNPTRNEFYKMNTLKGCYTQSIAKLFGKNSYYELMSFAGLSGMKNPSSPQQEVECLCCRTKFMKMTNQIRKGKNHFCSRSCAATYNNKIVKLKHGKNKENKTCLNCGTIHSRNSEFCSQKCKTESFMKTKTIKDALTKGERQQKYSNIRSIARNYARLLPDKHICQNCGYDKHVEIAHIKAISLFQEDELLIDVNNENNLLALCPNCHWELDNGKLTVEQILV